MKLISAEFYEAFENPAGDGFQRYATSISSAHSAVTLEVVDGWLYVTATDSGERRSCPASAIKCANPGPAPKGK